MNFCPNCGQPVDPSTGICTVCSKKQSIEGYPTADFTQYNTLDNYGGNFTSFLKSKLSSPVFLWFCILLTVIMVFAIAVCVLEGFSIPRMIELQQSITGEITDPEALRITSQATTVTLIITGVFVLAYAVVMVSSFWKTYFGARSQSLEMPLGGLKAISVIITITRVLIWIAVGFLALVTIIMFAVPSIFRSEMAAEEYGLFAAFFSAYAFMMLFVIALIVLMNIFYYGTIKKSIVSVIDSFRYNENRLEKMGTVRVWLIVFGVMSCMSALSALTMFPLFLSLSSIPDIPPMPVQMFGPPFVTLIVIAAISVICSAALYFLGAAIANKLNIPKELPPQTYIYAGNK